MGKYSAKLPNKDGIIDFTAEENETWKILITRQLQTIQNRACDEYLDGLKKLALPHDHVPQCAEVSKNLMALTGWSVVPVAAIIPLSEFFHLLSKRQFPAASFIRTREDLDYLQEPDIFHEIFGHCPFFAHKPYADFVQRYAEAALATDEKTQSILGRLFWYTIEFGLIQTPKGLRICGAGIISSNEETIYSLASDAPKRVPFDVLDTLRTEYRYDVIQKLYFYLEDFSQLYNLNIPDVVKQAKHIAENPFHEKDFVIC